MSASYRDVLTAAERISGRVHRTPVLTSTLLDDAVGASLYFKCEHLQKVGAFKARGAVNAVISLDESDADGEIGTVIGDYYLSFNKRSEYVYKTKTDCYGFSIRKKNWKSVIQNNPNIADELLE